MVCKQGESRTTMKTTILLTLSRASKDSPAIIQSDLQLVVDLARNTNLLKNLGKEQSGRHPHGVRVRAELFRKSL